MFDIDSLPSSSFLNEREVASILGIQYKTLTTWRHTRAVELPYLKIGRAVRYQVGDIRQFISENMRTSFREEVA